MFSVTGLPEQEDFNRICGDYMPDPLFCGYQNKNKDSAIMLVKAMTYLPKVSDDVTTTSLQEEACSYWTVSRMDKRSMATEAHKREYSKVRNYRVALAEQMRQKQKVQRLKDKLKQAEDECNKLESIAVTALQQCKEGGYNHRDYQINETILYFTPAQDGQPPIHVLWDRNLEEDGSKPTRTLPIMAFTSKSAKVRSQVAPAVHSMLPNRDGRQLDCHSARLRAECLSGLKLVNNGALVRKFWLRTQMTASAGYNDDLLFGSLDKRTSASYLQCRLVTLDSHTQSLAKVLLGSCAFASTCTTGWVQFTQYVGLVRSGQWPIADVWAQVVGALYAVIILVQATWLFRNWRDALGDVSKNRDYIICPQNEQGASFPVVRRRERSLTYISTVVIKAFDIPYDIAFSPARFHYKKVNQPWAQLKVGGSRVCVFGYPIVEMAKVENHGNRSVSQCSRLLVSFLSMGVQCATFAHHRDFSGSSMASLAVALFFSTFSLVFSAVILCEQSKEFSAAKFGVERYLEDTSKANEARRHAARKIIDCHFN